MKKILLFLILLGLAACVPAQTHTSYNSFALTAGGGTKTINLLGTVDNWYIYGTATLTSSWTITYSGTPALGYMVKFLYGAVVTLNGNNITIFGKALTATEALKLSYIFCTWNGSAWEVRLLTDLIQTGSIEGVNIKSGTITTTQLGTGAVNTANIRDSAVTVTKIEPLGSAAFILCDNVGVNRKRTMSGDVTMTYTGATTIGTGVIDSTNIAVGGISVTNLPTVSNKELVVFTLSFDTLEQCEYDIIVPYNCKVTDFYFQTIKDFSGTDSATVQLANSSSVSMTASGLVGGGFTIPPGSVVPYGKHVLPLTNNFFLAGQYIRISNAKGHPGGKMLVNMFLQRL